MQNMSAEDLKWQGRSDARTLAEANAIKADKARLENAKKEAKSMIAEREKELNGMRKVAGKSQRKVNNKPEPNTNNPWGRDLMAMPTRRY